MKKIKLFTLTNALLINTAAFLPLTACNGVPTEKLQITCDSPIAYYNEGKGTWTFTLNKAVPKEDLEINITSSTPYVSLSDFNITNKTLTVDFDAQVTLNGTQNYTFMIKITYPNESYDQSFTLTLYSVPLPYYNVKFEASTGGTLSGELSREVEKNTELLVSQFPTATPTSSSYVFEGWYIDDEEISTSTYKVTKEVTITAKFVAYEAEDKFTFSAGTITGYSGSNTNIYIPDKINGTNVTAIGGGAFATMPIVKIALPTYCTSIKATAFSICTSLKSITFNKNLVEIEPNAFDGCTNLVSVITKRDSEIWTEYDSNNEIVSQQKISVSNPFASKLKTQSQNTFKYVKFTNDPWTTLCTYANEGITKLHDVYGNNLIGMERLINYYDFYSQCDRYHRVRVVGEEQDELVYPVGNKAALTFELVNVLTTTTNGTIKPVRIDYTDSDSGFRYGGYKTTNLFKELDYTGSSNIYTTFYWSNSEWANLIKLVKKQTLAYDESASAPTSTEQYNAKLFATSYTEMTGGSPYGSLKDGCTNQYTYWSQHTSSSERTKHPTESNTNIGYWLATPTHYTYSWSWGFSGAYGIDEDGDVARHATSMWHDFAAISFAFCI